jgi:hypothetical protein
MQKAFSVESVNRMLTPCAGAGKTHAAEFCPTKQIAARMPADITQMVEGRGLQFREHYLVKHDADRLVERGTGLCQRIWRLGVEHW